MFWIKVTILNMRAWTEGVLGELTELDVPCSLNLTFIELVQMFLSFKNETFVVIIEYCC